MKRNLLLTGLFFLIHTLSFAQSNLPDSILQRYEKYPREALQKAESLYKQAKAERNTPLLLQSLFLKTAFSLKIDRDDYPRVLKELETYLSKEKQHATRSLLHSYIAELYAQYYSANRYLIRQRTPIQGEAPEDIKEWSQNLFADKVLTHYRASVQAQKVLQQTPAKEFEAVLIRGNASDSLRPTLYDILVHRAIDGLNNNPLFYNSPENSNRLLVDLASFLIALPFPEEREIENDILRLWQELLRFRKEAGEANALLMADLDRIEYYFNRPFAYQERDSLCISILERMRETYAHTPMVVEIMAKEATLWLNKNQKEKALALCQEGIKRFPKYNRINLLENLRHEIQSPNVRSSFPRQIYPGEKLPVTINYQNLDRIDIRLYRIQASTEQYTDNPDSCRQAFERRASSQTLELPKTLYEHDTTYRLAVPQPGLYRLVLKTRGLKDSISETFICSRLSTAVYSRNSQCVFLVNDWESGKPVKNAKILLYNSRRAHPTIMKTLFSDEKGEAVFPVSHDRSFYYQVINDENPNGYLGHYYSGYRERSRDSKNQEIITDRALYRPGQTVYFQGISWISTRDTLYPLQNKKVNLVLRDPQGNVVSEQKATTDSFGAFSGHFVLPKQLLNGQYYLTSSNAQCMIRVEEYKRPEFDIRFETPKQTYYAGDSIQESGIVKSFSGVALAHQEVQYEISSDFVRPGRYPLPSHTVCQGITHTDGEGKFTVGFKTNLPDSKKFNSSLSQYRIHVKITDDKGETQESNHSVMVYSDMPTPTLSIPEKVNKAVRTPFIIRLENLPPDKMQTVHYSIAQLKTPTEILQDNRLKDTLIVRTLFEADRQIGPCDTLQPDLSEAPSGAYLFTVKQGDSESKRVFYLYSLEDKRPPVPMFSWLTEEKTMCEVGDTAHIRFGTSLPDTYIVYELYGSKSIKKGTIVLSDEIKDIRIPLQVDFGKNMWLNLYFVKHKKHFQTTIPITRKEPERTLQIQTITFRDHLLPGQQETWKIRVLNNSGNVVPTQLLAFMYDASLDKIAPHRLFFNPRYLPSDPEFLRNWQISTESSHYNFGFLHFRNNGRSRYPYPAFQFDRLNTFQNRYDDYGDGLHFHINLSAASRHAKSVGNAILADGGNVEVEDFAEEESASTSPENEITYRQEFQETAFFYPQMQTDSLGYLTFSFTVPEALTTWKLNILAYTRQLESARMTRYITTSKPLMVRPNLPRFLRSGDHTVLKMTVSNLSDTLQEGSAGLELFLPDNRQVVVRQTADFHIAAKENQTLSFEFDVPENRELLGCRFFAGNREFNDGEQHLLPVLSNETLVMETLPIFTTQAGTHTYTLPAPAKTRRDYRLTFEMTANPIGYAVAALPALSKPTQEDVMNISASFYVNTIASKIAHAHPEIVTAIRQWQNSSDATSLLAQLERNKELKSVLLETSPWTLEAKNETERIQQLAELFNENRLHHLQEQAISQLSKLQNDDGGWGWFKGMYSSPFMTNNVLTILAQSVTTGDYQPSEAVKKMQIKALQYLDNQIAKDYEEKHRKIGYDHLLYLYTRSHYRDIPLGKALEAHKHFMASLQKEWGNFSFYEKAIAAVASLRYGFRNTASDILASLRQYAVSTPENGMYWPNNRNRYYRNSAIQVHTAIMEAFYTVEGNTPDLDQMKQWLLRQKQVQDWGSVPATVDAIYALLLTGQDLLSEKETLTVQLGKQEYTVSSQENPLGYLKKSYSAAEIRPQMLTAKITKQKDMPSWGGIYLQYFEKLDQVKKQKTDISVDKKLFIERNNAQGQAELIPLEGQELKIGDKVTVRLTLSLKQDMEFLHLKDLRAACFEPMQQLSGNHWKFGTVYYQDTKDAATHFFFQALSRGTYVIEYPVRISRAGSYRDGIATLQSVYSPEFNAHSDAQTLEVEP